MIRATIAAALLAGLASRVLALAPAGSPAYDQAAGLAATRNADMAYDGNATRTPVQAQVHGALTTGGLAVEPPSVTAAPRQSLAADEVPVPTQDAANGGFFTKRGLLYGAGGAAVGAGAGWFFGGPLGAAIGALAGFAIGFVLSKLLG